MYTNRNSWHEKEGRSNLENFCLRIRNQSKQNPFLNTTVWGKIGLTFTAVYFTCPRGLLQFTVFLHNDNGQCTCTIGPAINHFFKSRKTARWLQLVGHLVYTIASHKFRHVCLEFSFHLLAFLVIQRCSFCSYRLIFSSITISGCFVVSLARFNSFLPSCKLIPLFFYRS